MISSPETPVPGSAARFSWALYDWAGQPFHTLIATFIFAPYFVSVYIGDPVEGQALWGYLQGTAGIIVALSAPFLGAVADAAGRLKPWVALFTCLTVISAALLWWAAPGQAYYTPVLVAIVLGIVGSEFAIVFTNSYLPDLARPGRMGRLSGLGWGLGYLGGILSLALMLAFFAADRQTGLTLFGFSPIFGLDPASHDGARASGPFTAIWFIIFALPLFIFVPDRKAKKSDFRNSLKTGFDTLAATLRELKTYRNAALFLLARMIYTDGLVTIFVFGGIYAGSLFNWPTQALGIFGIIISVAAAAGAFAGGILDDAIGSKKTVLIAVAGLSLGALGIVSITNESVLFGIPVEPWTDGGPVFSSTPERFCLAAAIIIGLAAGPAQAASRTLMARIAPPDKITEFFGLYAFSGKITAFAGPLLVALVTDISGQQRPGLYVVIIMLALGFALLTLVRDKP